MDAIRVKETLQKLDGLDAELKHLLREESSNGGRRNVIDCVIDSLVCVNRASDSLRHVSELIGKH